MDTDKDGDVDADDGFIDDGTGMHPTPTTYAASLVAESTSINDEVMVTPSVARYHVPRTDIEIAAYNLSLGTDLEFNDAKLKWANYVPHEFDYTGIRNSQGIVKKVNWVEGFEPRYSWDFTSPITGEEYANICPTIIFFEPHKTRYYFFEIIFNDFQAVHGYDNWSIRLDGWPSPRWPGMVKCEHSLFGGSQRPLERSTYEEWFNQTYGEGFYFAAPLTQPTSLMSNTPCPKRFRNIDSKGRIRRSDVPAEADDVEPPPPFRPDFNNNIGVQLGGKSVFTRDVSRSKMEYGHTWMYSFSGYDADAFDGVDKVWPTLVEAQKGTGTQVGTVLSYSAGYLGFGDVKSYKPQGTLIDWWSGWLREGPSSQRVGWVINIGQTSFGQFFSTGWGTTSLSPVASVGGSSTYVLQSPSTQEEILAQMLLAPGQGCLGFLYDADEGLYGTVTWLSQV